MSEREYWQVYLLKKQFERWLQYQDCPVCGNPLDKCLCDPGDGLHTCSICGDRYTTNESGVCDSCRQQQWIDEHG